MDTATINAFVLLALAVYVFWRVIGSKAQAVNRPRSDEHVVDLERLQQLYARKRLFRYGMLACSVASALVYVGGGGRAVPLLLLGGAALCQYGAARQRTGEYCSRILQQNAAEPRGGGISRPGASGAD